MNTKLTTKTLGSENIIVVKSSPNWPFPKVVGGIPMPKGYTPKEEKPPYASFNVGVKRSWSSADYANASNHVGEALL